MFHKYYLPVCGLPFHFLNSIFFCVNFLLWNTFLNSHRGCKNSTESLRILDLTAVGKYSTITKMRKLTCCNSKPNFIQILWLFTCADFMCVWFYVNLSHTCINVTSTIIRIQNCFITLKKVLHAIPICNHTLQPTLPLANMFSLL